MQIPTSDLRDLSSDPQRLQCLLIYVVEKCLLRSDVEALHMVPGDNVTLSFLSSARVLDSGGPIYDTTLRFTLSALWNLTDECPEACHAFVAVGGLKIYAKVLKVGALSFSLCISTYTYNLSLETEPTITALSMAHLRL